MDSIARVVQKSVKPAVLTWQMPLSEASPAPRKFLFVESPALSLAEKLRGRGHSVSYASVHKPSDLPQGVEYVRVEASSAPSKFGNAFDESFAVFSSLKNAEAFDVIVFPSGDLAYVTMEAKRGGIALSSTTIVVDVEALPARDSSYTGQVTRFIAEEGMMMADSLVSSSEAVTTHLTLPRSATMWLASTEEQRLSLLESAHSVPVSVAVEKPLVSVIVTAFNRPALLRQAVESVQAQTYRNVEIIVVDDGSTNAEMPAALAALDKAGVHVVRQANQYLGAARNNGARNAKGEFLLFLDDDNVALPTMVEKLVTAASVSHSDIAVNAHYVWRAASKPVPVDQVDVSQLPLWCPVGPAVVPGIKGNVFGNANFLIRRETFYGLSGFTEDRAGWEDYEFHAKSAISGVPYVMVPEGLMLFRQHDVYNQMSAATNVIANRRRLVRAYEQLLSEAEHTAEEVAHDFSQRDVTSCETPTFVDNTVSCFDTRISVQATGDSSLYGGFAGSAPLVAWTRTSDRERFELGSNDYEVITTPTTFPGAYVLGLKSTSALAQTTLKTPGEFVVSFSFSSNGNSITCGSPLQANSETLPSCRNVCFHKDSVIEYEGRQHTFEQLKSHPKCAIPHEVTAVGVSIRTTCTPTGPALRLTDDHLVYTQHGLRKAIDVKVGDLLFADLNEQHSCKVTSIVPDAEPQHFFGLNCLSSTVLASGIKTSTFGNIHALPALWMSWAGRVLGVDRASRWGDALANFAYRTKIIA
jgi:GT2 family glycosyltransferase